MQEIDLMSPNRRPENGWDAAEHDQKSTRSAEYHDECIQQVWNQSPGLIVWKWVDTMRVWWVDRQMGKQPNEWMDKPIPMPMTYVTSTIFANLGQIMVLYPITIKLLLREVLVFPWSRYGGILCEITQLHVIKMWPEQRVCDFSDIFKFVLFKKFVLQISLNCVPDFLTNDKSALVQPSLSFVLGVKPLSKPVTDGYTDGCNTTKLLQVQCCHQLQFHPCWLINW